MTKYSLIIEKFVEIASEIFRNDSGEVYIFGSRARKDYNEYSDWDLLVLTEENLGKEEIFNKYGFPFCEIGWYLKEDINPLVFTKSEWDSQKSSFFYHNVMKDAIKIYS